MSALKRRDLLILALIVLAGWGIQRWLAGSVPLGTDLTGNSTVAALLADSASPTRDVARPTLTLVVFTDYQCPACKAAAPAMDAAVARDGHVRIVYRDWPIFGERSVRAARVALAADRQHIYPTVHTRLMAEARPLDDTVLREAIEGGGGDWARIERDLREQGAAIDAQLAATAQAAVRLGVNGTPTYLAGSILVAGALDEKGFARAFAAGRAVRPKGR